MTVSPHLQQRWQRIARNPKAQVLFGWLLLSLIQMLAIGKLTPNSDQATILLQAQSILSHNLLLKGWVLPSDNFLVVTTFIYAPFVKILGLNIVILRIVPSLLYALATTLLVILARQQLPQKARRIAGILIVGLLGFPAAYGVFPPLEMLFFEHTTTIIGIAGSWLLFRDALDPITGSRRRQGRLGWLELIAATALLTLAVFDDPFTLFLFVGPLLIFRTVECARLNNLHAALRTGFWVIFSTLLGEIGAASIRHLGGYTEVLPLVHILTINAFPAYAGRFITFLFQVTGANFWGGQLHSVDTLLAGIHAIVLLVFVYAVSATIISWIRRLETDEISIVCALAVIVMSTALLTSEHLTSGTQRYVLMMYCMGLPCMVRRIAMWGTSERLLPIGRYGAIALVVIASFLSFAPALHDHPQNPYTPVVTFLADHHLTNGVGDYWDATILTVASHGKADVRSVYYLRAIHNLVIQQYLTDQSWYTSTTQSPQWFAIWRPQNASYGVTLATATAAFGKPTATYVVNGYTIAVWPTDIMHTILDNQAKAAQALGGKVPALPPT